MCLSTPKPPAPPPVAPPPTRADEENRQAVDEQLRQIRARQGRSATFLSPQDNSAAFGSNVQGVQLLGQAGNNA